jgi:Flp pilus assembly protein TadG
MRRRDQRGQSLVETALVLPILLVILMGIFDFGRAIFAFNAVSNSAREAARVAIVNQNATAVEDEGKRAAIGLDPDAIDVTFAIPDCGTVLVGCTASVTVDHEWTALTPIIGSLVGPIDLSSTTEMKIERAWNAAP